MKKKRTIVEKPKITELCPACGADTYVVSIFGSICGTCLYEPPR